MLYTEADKMSPRTALCRDRLVLTPPNWVCWQNCRAARQTKSMSRLLQRLTPSSQRGYTCKTDGSWKGNLKSKHSGQCEAFVPVKMVCEECVIGKLASGICRLIPVRIQESMIEPLLVRAMDLGILDFSRLSSEHSFYTGEPSMHAWWYLQIDASNWHISCQESQASWRCTATSTQI